jgi:hypothetical protein
MRSGCESIQSSIETRYQRESWRLVARLDALTPTAIRSTLRARGPTRSQREWTVDRGWDDQLCGMTTSTIQGTPNLSVHMPNMSPHICFSNGIVTLPPSESLSQ